MVNLKRMMRRRRRRKREHFVDWIQLVQRDPMAVFCGYDSKPQGRFKCEDFLIGCATLFKDDSAT